MFKGGKARMKFKTSVGIAAVDANQPVNFQVVTGSGQCWGAYFGVESIKAHPRKVGVIKARY